MDKDIIKKEEKQKYKIKYNKKIILNIDKTKLKQKENI